MSQEELAVRGEAAAPLVPGSAAWKKELAAVKKQYADLDIPFGLAANDTDNTLTAAQIEARLLGATTLEDIYLASDAPEKFENHIGSVFTVRDFAWRPSDKGDGIWPYAVIDAVSTDGGTMLISAGARKVVITLALCKLHNLLPAPFRFTSAETAAGNEVYGLARP